MVIVLIGPPGAGKGTQARLLVQRLNRPHISTGDIFRATSGAPTPAAAELRNLMSAGKLLPHHLVMEVVRERTTQPDCASGYILDGFPRTLEQALMLDTLTRSQNHKIMAIKLHVPLNILESRIEGRRTCAICGDIYNTWSKLPCRPGFCDHHPLVQLTAREEDNRDKLKLRLIDFENLTIPVIDYYQQSNRLERVDGTQHISLIHERIVSFIQLRFGTI